MQNVHITYTIQYSMSKKPKGILRRVIVKEIKKLNLFIDLPSYVFLV